MGVLRLGVDLTVSETLPWMSGSEQCRQSGVPFSADSGMGLYSIRKDLGFLVPLTFTLWIKCLGKINLWFSPGSHQLTHWFTFCSRKIVIGI